MPEFQPVAPTHRPIARGPCLRSRASKMIRTCKSLRRQKIISGGTSMRSHFGLSNGSRPTISPPRAPYSPEANFIRKSSAVAFGKRATPTPPLCPSRLARVAAVHCQRRTMFMCGRSIVRSSREASAPQGLLLDEKLLARSLPLSRRHNRWRVHSVLSFFPAFSAM